MKTIVTEARFGGYCGQCGARYPSGTTITRVWIDDGITDLGWCHIDCDDPEGPDDDPAPAGICPRCHLALPLSGECDC